jgi:hypothetical protein
VRTIAPANALGGLTLATPEKRPSRATHLTAPPPRPLPPEVDELAENLPGRWKPLLSDAARLRQHGCKAGSRFVKASASLVAQLEWNDSQRRSALKGA